MVDLIAGLSIFQAFAITAFVAVFAIAIQRRYLSSISDIPGPFLGSFSLLWQLQKIFTKHTERATIDAHKKWGMSLFPRLSSEAVTEILKC